MGRRGSSSGRWPRLRLGVLGELRLLGVLGVMRLLWLLLLLRGLGSLRGSYRRRLGSLGLLLLLLLLLLLRLLAWGRRWNVLGSMLRGVLRRVLRGVLRSMLGSVLGRMGGRMLSVLSGVLRRVLSMGRRVGTRGRALPSGSRRRSRNWVLLLGRRSLRLLAVAHGCLRRRGSMVLSVLGVLLLVRMLWLSRLWRLCGVRSIIHGLVATAHVGLLLGSIRRLSVPSGMVSRCIRLRRRLLLLQLLLVLQR